ncbi:MAG: T9SS type A sorting domain-containing protein [Bacteroidetes bacterium]|nr:T9SS type A sorting domain-containing protein [Bacteroidota bacterium]
MKAFLFTLITCSLLFTFQPSKAQSELWSTTTYGKDGMGSLFKTDSAGNGPIVTPAFSSSVPGRYPNYNKLCESNSQRLYGTMFGGSYGQGILYEFDPLTEVYTKKIDFNGTNGTQPEGGLVKAANGKLYGVTHSGGTSGLGTLFEYDPTTNVLITKVNFLGSSNGAYPMATLFLASNGKLYGTTEGGGSANLGTLFEYTVGSTTVSRRYSFNNSTGVQPRGVLAQASNGKLYGLTPLGGAYDSGILFEFTIGTSTITKKFDFNGSVSGAYPNGGLTKGLDGVLYGMTGGGGANDEGVFFEYDAIANLYTKTHDFNGISTGAYPKTDIFVSPSGLLYGLTSEGGTAGVGTLFEYDPINTTIIKKMDFSSVANGAHPMSAMVLAYNGLAYGLTSEGGTASLGTLFKYDFISDSYTKIIDLLEGATGGEPKSGVILANDGLIYGVAGWGGAYGFGTIYKFDPSTNANTHEIVYSFTTATGRTPYARIIQASNGKFYGTTFTGGANDYGVIYEYDPLSSLYTKLFDFSNTAGSYSFGALLESGGLLYGMCNGGGSFGLGTLFSFDITSGIFTKWVDFDGSTKGQLPRGELTLGSNGKIYGMASRADATHLGVIFEFDQSTHVFTKKYDFPVSSGSPAYPYGKLTEAPNGMFYGTTSEGGTSGAGCIFEFNPTTNAFTKKFDFVTSTSGKAPCGNLFLANDGKLYGLTSLGGANGGGTTFQYDYISNVFTKKIDFNTTTGHNPNSTIGFIEVCQSIYIVEQPTLIQDCVGNPVTINSGVTPGAGISFQWYKDAVAIIGATSATYDILSADTINNGLYFCNVSNTCRNINTPTVNLSVEPVQLITPATPGPISGASNICPYLGLNVAVTYSVSPVVGASVYIWTVPAYATILSGQGTNSINVRYSSAFVAANITVMASASCGGNSGISSLGLTKTLATTPGPIAGPKNNLCPLTTYTYTTTPVASATSYTWAVPSGTTIISGQGTTSLSVSFPATFASGTITVKSVNQCSNSSTVSYAVSKKPATPGAITGIKNVCANIQNGTPLTYSITALAGVSSYQWTTPLGVTLLSGQGTTSVSLSFDPSFVSGTVTVCAVGTCINSNPASIALTNAAALPASISGDGSICTQITNGTDVVYSTPFVSSALSYIWTIPSGATIVSGGGTNTILVHFDTTVVTGSLIKVAILNMCGATSGTRQKSLTTCHMPILYQDPNQEIFASDNSDSNAKDIFIFPNPAEDLLNITLNSSTDEDVTLLVYNVLGEIVYERKHFIQAGEQTITTNIGDWVSGAYQIVVIGQSGRRSKTIVKK